MKLFYTFLFITLSSQLFGQGPEPRMETNLDDVYSMYNLSGDGVLAVVIDRGVDYRHTDFIDGNGNTRIKYVFDMIDNSGVNEPGNTYGVGTIFDETEINQALANADPPLTMDRYGHGTATAGIIGGDGSGTMDLQFQGVAPEVTYIIIKITHDPFPAFGNQPGQSGFFDPSYIPIALDFAHDKITELGMPSVTLMNIGSTGGPTDGTSLITREIDQYIAQGHPFVCGVGDDGGGANHASGTISQGQTIEIEVNKAGGNLRFDMWYSEDDRFTVSIERPNGTVEGPFAAPAGPANAVDQFLTGISMFHRGADAEFFGATSNRRELLIDFSGTAGVYKVILEGASVAGGGEFHATLNPANFSQTHEFLSFVTPGTSIADYAASVFGITPTDYVVDNTWTDIDGIARSISGQGNPGEKWLGSSQGPTQDGRRGVDFASPGEVCFAAYSPDTYYSNFAFNMVQGGNSNYGLQNAVSAAAPLATGIIALMLEVNPDLSPAEVKSILQQSCVADGFTGTVPNDTWGYGKIDAFQVIQNTLATVEVEELSAHHNAIRVNPNPFSDIVRLDLVDPTLEIESVEVFDSQGRLVCQMGFSPGAVSFNLEFLNAGLYILGVKTNKNYFTSKLIKN